ncbi:MAG: aminotransferase class V-fold PLP-dependent enzyme, partial [Firmicutes bacterium]|nr:aminotransferase class V-fold PLP-dependent enzyme [Bacillota bacterium]
MIDNIKLNKELILSPQEMQTLGYKVVDLLIEHIANVHEKPVTQVAKRATLETRLALPFPELGRNSDDVLRTLQEDIFCNMMHLDHPRCFGSISSPSNFISVMADTLAAGFNVFAGTWLEASGPAQIELTTIDWLRQICGMPTTAGGLFVSGGSVANLTALAVAKKQRSHKQTNSVVYTSKQAHASIERAMQMLGFSKDQLVKIPTDEGFRLSMEALKDTVAHDRRQNKHPFCVVATAGTTNTGAVDPLGELAKYCQHEQLWLHVDGAYGAPAILTTKGCDLLDGLGEADSLTIDPHKWLFQPYEASCILLKDVTLLKDAFHILPDYLKDAQGEEDEINFYDYGIQLSRSFKALKLWMSLQVFGIENFRAAINNGMEMAELAAKVVVALPGWELVTQPQLGMVNFRYLTNYQTPQPVTLFNERLVTETIKDGFAMVSSTV